MAVCGVPIRLFGRSELRMHRRGAPERLRERPGSAPAADTNRCGLWELYKTPSSQLFEQLWASWPERARPGASGSVSGTSGSTQGASGSAPGGTRQGPPHPTVPIGIPKSIETVALRNISDKKKTKYCFKKQNSQLFLRHEAYQYASLPE